MLIFLYTKDGYAKKSQSACLKEEVQELIDLSKFDENDPVQHQIKILFGCGKDYGFRGNSEHTFLEVMNVVHGKFPTRHPYSGYDYYGFEGLIDKTNNLSYNQDYVRDCKDAMRLPKMNNDPTSNDIAGSIERFLKKLSPGQTRFYCKVIPEKFRVEDENGKIPYFYGHCPIGKTGINKLFKEGAKILGLPNPESFCAHSLRAYFVTRVSNGKGVNDEERMVSARHDSVGASAIYQERNCVSKSNKFLALGIAAPTKQR